MPRLGNSLIQKAKIHDRDKNIKLRKSVYTDEEIELAGAWFEGEISTSSVAEVMGMDSTNVANQMSTALKQGIATGRVAFTWHPPKGSRKDG